MSTVIFTRFRGAARPLMQPCGMFRTDSSCRQQSRQPDKVVSCGLELKHPAHAREAAEFGLRHAAHHLDPAIRLLDPLTDDLADRVAGMARRPAIDVRTAMPIDVLRHMRSGGHLPCR